MDRAVFCSIGFQERKNTKMGVVTGQFFSKFGVDVSLKILHR